MLLSRKVYLFFFFPLLFPFPVPFPWSLSSVSVCRPSALSSSHFVSLLLSYLFLFPIPCFPFLCSRPLLLALCVCLPHASSCLSFPFPFPNAFPKLKRGSVARTGHRFAKTSTLRTSYCHIPLVSFIYFGDLFCALQIATFIVM